MKKLLALVGLVTLLAAEPAFAANGSQFQFRIVPQECTIDTVDNGQGPVQVITCPPEPGQVPQGPLVIPEVPSRTIRRSGSSQPSQPTQPQEDIPIPTPTGDADYYIDAGKGGLIMGPLSIVVVALVLLVLLLLIANSIFIALFGHGLFAAAAKRRRKRTE
ncbi:MAG: hypothetical protein ACREGJ_03890 [Candidatus Saccharimonadales bacterium]